jgi:hypothetical protein
VSNNLETGKLLIFFFCQSRQAYSILAKSGKYADLNSSAATSATGPALSFKSEGLSIPPSTHPAADREKYPLVKYWYRHEWNAAEVNQAARIGAQGKTRVALGENVSLKFIEDETGVVIDGFRVTAIRRFARELWAGLNSIGKAPKTWGKVDAAVAAQYRNEMEQKYPELRLCDNHWKADLIATLGYPSWSNSHLEKEEHLKRSSANPPPDAKKPRTFMDASAPPPIPHKKRAKRRAGEAAKEADSQLSTARLLSCCYALINLSPSQNFSSIASPEAPEDANRHSTMQCDPPVLVSTTDSNIHPRSRVRFNFGHYYSQILTMVY